MMVKETGSVNTMKLKDISVDRVSLARISIVKIHQKALMTDPLSPFSLLPLPSATLLLHPLFFTIPPGATGK